MLTARRRSAVQVWRLVKHDRGSNTPSPPLRAFSAIAASMVAGIRPDSKSSAASCSAALTASSQEPRAAWAVPWKISSPVGDEEAVEARNEFLERARLLSDEMRRLA
jgi:hypothetical protein